MKQVFAGFLLLAVVFSGGNVKAEDRVMKAGESMCTDTTCKVPIRKIYNGNSLDGMIFSTAMIDNKGVNSLGTLRFTMFFNFGSTFNYNFNKTLGVYTGVDIKNIGFIEKYSLTDATMKQRVYTLGVPLGIKVGNMPKNSYFFLGGGVDLAFHYKEKFWSATVKKQKYGEWFSDHTNLLMPYVFAGLSIKSSSLKIQYYPGNFLNESFSGPTAMGTLIAPYAGKKVNLLLISVGRDIKFKRKSKCPSGNSTSSPATPTQI